MKMNYRRKNPVARVLNQINRPQTHRDRTKYKRNEKYRQNFLEA
jgi:hypothetical protein